MKERETIEELLSAKEGENYQFKEWKTKNNLSEATKICCALANCGGGKLVLGVTDKRPREVVGTTAFPQPERTRFDLMSKLHVGVDFFIHQHENGRVLVFEVASRPVGLPVQIESGTWWYHGDSLIHMPEDVRRTIYAESDHDFSGDICPGATIHDLDDGAIKVFRKTWVENKGNNRIANLSVTQLLRDCSALTDDGVTYAALILFGKRNALIKYLPHAEIVFEYRSSETAGPAAHRVDFRDGFFNCYDKVWELVNLRNDNQHYQDGLHVYPVPTFNEKVTREALLNAVSHREYKLGGSIFIRQYARRLVVENPGGFPWGITVENVLNRHSARNNRIASIFQLCGLVEKAGQGMNMMYETAMKEAKPLPDFSGSDSYFTKLTLFGQVYDPKMLALTKKTNDEVLGAMTTDDYNLLRLFFHRKRYAEVPLSEFTHLAELGLAKFTAQGIELVDNGITLLTNENGVYVVDDDVDDVDSVVDDGGDVVDNVVDDDADVVDDGRDVVDDVDNFEEVLMLIKEKPHMTAKQLSISLSLGERQVQRIIRKLKETNRIRRIGSDRSGHWEITE